MRILRRENYLVGLLAQGVLDLRVPLLPGAAGRRQWLTRSIQWNLYWTILDPMLDSRSFAIRPHWADEAALARARMPAPPALSAAP